MSIILDSAFRCSRSNVESHSTALSTFPGRKASHSTELSVPSRMSSHTRQRFMLFQCECPVTRQRLTPFQFECQIILDSYFRSSKVECRVILDSAFRCSRSNVEAHSTSLSAVPGRTSSHIRQRSLVFQGECRVIVDSFPPFQVECRVTFDSAFRPSRSNVESHSTALSAVPVRK